MFTTRASDKSSKASLEQILGRLQAVLKALHLAAWLVLFEYILLAVSVPLELPLAIAAGFAAAAAIVGLLGGIGAMRWEPAKQPQRAMSLATALEAAALVGVATFMVMQFRQDVPELADLRMLQVVALVQFVAGIMVVPFLARTTGRLGGVAPAPTLGRQSLLGRVCRAGRPGLLGSFVFHAVELRDAIWSCGAGHCRGFSVGTA